MTVLSISTRVLSHLYHQQVSFRLSERAVCTKPLEQHNGWVERESFSREGNPVLGSKQTLHCNRGFVVDGPKARTCQQNGTWSGIPALCVRIGKGTFMATGIPLRVYKAKVF